MRYVGLRAGLMLAGALVAGRAVAAPLPSAAQDPVAAVCRPVLLADGRPVAAGTAFLMAQPRPSEAPIVMTAQHLFGRAGGLARDIPALDMRERAQMTGCKVQDGPMLRGDHTLIVDEAVPMVLPLRDVAAFAPRMDSLAGASVLHMAADPPAIGDDVWVVAAMGNDGRVRRHRARVVHSGVDALQYVFGDGTLRIEATDGAPVVNAQGDVVGLHLGGGRDGADLLGTAVPTAVLTRLAASAL